VLLDKKGYWMIKHAGMGHWAEVGRAGQMDTCRVDGDGRRKRGNSKEDKIVSHDIHFGCHRFEICKLNEPLFKHAFDRPWHGELARPVKVTGCNLVDRNVGDLTIEEWIQLHNILEVQYNLRHEHMDILVVFVVGLYDEVHDVCD